MARRLRLSLVCLTLCLFAIPFRVEAESFEKTSNSVFPATTGPSAILLNGPWKFHIGDDPRWADPAFNDSGWEDYFLDPRHRILTPEQAIQSGELPGWQQHGHPGYTGYAWYRTRLALPQNNRSIALLMPSFVNDAYEVYVNGSKIAGLGRLNGLHLTYAGQPKLLMIPYAVSDNGQPITVAIRFWNLRSEALPAEQNLDGGLRGVPVIGPSSLLEVYERSLREQTGQIPWWLLLHVDLYGAVGLISLFLFLLSRGQHEYLWAGIRLTGFAVMLGFISVLALPQTMISFQLAVTAQAIAYTAAVFAMPLAAMYLLGVPRSVWRRANYLVFALNLLWTLEDVGVTLGLLPPTAAMDRFVSVSEWLAIPLLASLLLAIAVDGVRSNGRKAWLPMTPGLLFALYVNMFLLFPRVIPDRRFWLIAECVCACVPPSVLIIFLMRFTRQQRENIRLADDMWQAQEVQQLMLPEARASFPGFDIECEYRPAREVGRDFFQIIPHKFDGSLLIVAGDVTGKGLKAGMLVALLVGAIRTAARFNPDPIAMLIELNQRLLGRTDAQATCLALCTGPDGTATLANAGHLPPYLNGEPVAMEGALPLGMIECAEFSVTRFQLKTGDKLVLMSDGVAEATNADGHLFGCERVHDLLHSAKSAAEVANAAQSFGQEDDISVIYFTRTAALEAASA